VQGAAGAIGGRVYQKLTGAAAKEARAGDLGRFIDSQQDPTTKALFERVRDTHGVDTASALMDVEGLVKGRFGDVDVKYLSDTDFVDQYKGRARGVQVEVGDRPTIVINADILGKGKGDSPLYTLGHELFHALEKSEQLAGGATEIKNALVGRWIQEGDVIRKLSDGAFNDAEIEARFNEYRDKLSAGSPQRAAELAQFDTINKKADYIASELAAEHFAALIAGQKPDAMLKGFSGLTRQLLDAALTQNASKAIANAAASIERTFGVKPTDSVLFPDLKQASPQVNAMLRDLVRARRKLDEKIMLDDIRGGRVLKPEDVSNPLAAKELVDLGLAEQMPDGSIRNLSSDEIRARDDKDLTSLRSITEKVPGARMVDGEITGRFSPEQLSAIEQSQTISSRMKDKIRAVNLAMENGNSLFVTYFAALKRVRNKLTKKYSPKYDSGIRVSEREFSPYSFKITKADNPVVNAIDITKVRNELSKLLKKDGSIGGLWSNTDGFMTDLARYFTNLDQREGARRSAEIFGVEKAKFLGDFVGAGEKTGSKFVRSFRLDRVGSMSPMDFKAKFSEEAYQLSKQRWMPAETIGDKSVTNSEEGYRIISGAKHKLYGPDGKLIGIYDTQTQAERKADATQARLQPEVDQQQRLPRNEGRQATEAGRGDSALGRTQGREEGRQELGTVRQAGDVVQNFDALVAAAPDVRFMPVESQPENAPVAGRITKGQQASIDELSQYYASKTPDRAKVLKSDAIDSLASRLINKGVPVQEANAIASKTFSKLRKGVSGALQVISGMGLSDLSRMAGTGKPSVERRPHINQNWLTSAFEAFATDEGLALMKAQQVATQLNKADQAKAAAGESVEAARASGVRQSTMQQGMEFVLGEMNADRKAFGTSLREDLDSPPRVYASVGEGQKFGGQGNYNVFFEWKKETPMVVTSHHHYGVANGVTGIHAQGNIGDKNARSFGNPSAEKYDTLPSGKQVLDTHLLVGNQGVPDARAHQLTVSIPDSSLSGIRSVYKEKGAAGVEAELNRIAVSQMVGTKSQGKTKAFTSKEGIPPMVAIQKNRTEAYVLNPDLANVASVTIVSNSPKEVALIRKNIEKTFENNGSALPKVKVVSAESGASGNVGRKAITDEYFKLTGEQRFMPAGDMATGRGVKDHREAMDLFEKGYRLYGALYDGMEDPIRLKKASEIERFDPENLWAVPSKKIAAAISVRNMPASDTDYLSAVKKGDTATAQRMVDEAAKAAGYTIGPVYHGTPTGGFNVFDKRMRGETSGVSRQAFSFTTDKKAAEGYSKRLGDEAVRLDAGLRVANDAMRMFDEDMAAQEYFSSKGYSSVDDGMLPEFDWGSIDDVPEFIKELRGYAKDLKPINKRLSDNFIEAAKVMTSTKAVPEVKRVFLRIPEGAPVFQATPQTLGQVMSGFSAENQPTKAGIVELPGNERIYYVADSSQVKLVDPITKDNAGNVIPLSQRFKATSEDIRYMPETIQRDVGRNQDFANPPTDTEAVDALSSEKKAKFGAARSIKPGTQVAARIDIPAFLRTGKYVVAVHEPDGAAGGPGKVIGYDTVTRLQNPKFVVKPGVQRIYEGKSAKFPVATVDGKIMADRSIPADLENYVPVGMDPKEHAFFYDKRTDQPVIGGSESVSVGNTVFVKNPVYGDPSKFAFMPSPDSAMPGAYSFPGGYRALPGKAKGSLRLYGPAGSLIGIASSLDEAQRILRRKGNR
jgi:hypothetical protein